MRVGPGHDADAGVELALEFERGPLRLLAGVLGLPLLEAGFEQFEFAVFGLRQRGEPLHVPVALAGQEAGDEERGEQRRGHEDRPGDQVDPAALGLAALQLVEGVHLVLAPQPRPRLAGERGVLQDADARLVLLLLARPGQGGGPGDAGLGAGVGRGQDHFELVNHGESGQLVQVGARRLGQATHLLVDLLALVLEALRVGVRGVFVALAEVVADEFGQRLAEVPGLVEPLADERLVRLFGPARAAVKQPRQPADQHEPDEDRGGQAFGVGPGRPAAGRFGRGRHDRPPGPVGFARRWSMSRVLTFSQPRRVERR